MRLLSRPPVVFSLLASLVPVAAHAADPAHGKQLFVQSCALCHSSGQEKPGTAAVLGPLLAGVVGRHSGSVEGFNYTKAMLGADLMWTEPNLDKFLTAPTVMVPGTAMVLPVPSASDRADLIAFLAKLQPPTIKRVPDRRGMVPHDRTPGDWQNDAPGNHHEIDLTKLPAPFASVSAGNSPKVVDRPEGAHLSVPAGFQIKLFLSDLSGPRQARTAPNGDVFVTESGRGRVRVLRTKDGADAPVDNQVFATGLDGPFGMAFYPAGPDPKWVYVANNNSIVRYAYHNGDLKAQGEPETVVAHLSDSTGGHSSRDIAFSADGKTLFISVGSGSNVADGMPTKSVAEANAWEAQHGLGAAWGYEEGRASIMVTDPEGKTPLKAFATGVRNAVTIAVQPETGELWCSTNERDALGDDLVPDYITHLEQGKFYGWPWYYYGNHEDPRHAGERPDLKGKITVPDVPIQSHSASLELMFYPKDASGVSAFPAEYRGNIFAAEHGSWNRTGRTGSKIIRIVLKDGKPTGGYEDFVTGFVIDDGHVWGRPVGVAMAHDGSLLITDDAGGTMWRISRTAP